MTDIFFSVQNDVCDLNYWDNLCNYTLWMCKEPAYKMKSQNRTTQEKLGNSQYSSLNSSKEPPLSKIDIL